MTQTIFIDGEVGTTGLQIRERLKDRADLSLLHLPEAERKDVARRADMLNSVDVVILCLPDDAARDAIAMIKNSSVRVIDASSAHRVAEGWAYGMPEYDNDQAEKIASASRVTNPGCYAITSVSILYPLTMAGIVPHNYAITINAISGYSGGGKQMIAGFETGDGTYANTPFRVYGLDLNHKHVLEVQKWGGLEHAPLLVPSVGHFRQGMIVQVPLQLWSLPGSPTPEDVHAALAHHYAGQRFVTVKSLAETADMTGLEPEGLNGTNELHLHVFGNEDTGQAVVMGLIDNLGKGASGQAVQNLNLMIDAPVDAGL
jgi:N-acetyl-gamma-glutamyl-phosphate reductase